MINVTIEMANTSPEHPGQGSESQPRHDEGRHPTHLRRRLSLGQVVQRGADDERRHQLGGRRAAESGRS